MTVTKKIYTMADMEEQDQDRAPSLDLKDVVLEKFYMPRDKGKYMLFTANALTLHAPDVCGACGEVGTMKRAGHGEPRLVHDVPRNNYRVDIVILPQRFECKNCGAKITPPTEGVEEKRSMTTRLLEYLKTECFLQTHTVLAELSGFSVESIQNIMDEEIKKYDADRQANPIEAPRVLGIDEKHITNIMRGTLVNVESGQLLDMLENNSREMMIDGIKRLKNWDTNIRVVTTDMNNAYLNWLLELLPNATIVIDKFHVFQDVHRRIGPVKKTLVEYRKELISKIEDPTEKARQKAVLNMALEHPRLFNYSLETMVRNQDSKKALKLATVLDEFPEFKLLRKLLYLLELMYQQETLEEAESVWDEWMELLPPNGNKKYAEWCDLYSVVPPLFDAFRSFSRTGFQFFKPYILNYFRPGCRHTNAATEGLNTLIERINRDGNGLSFKSLRAKSLYASLIHERTLYGIDLKSIRKWKPTHGMISASGAGTDGTYTYKDVYEFTAQTVSLDSNAIAEIMTCAEETRIDTAIGVDEPAIVTAALKELEAINAYFDKWRIT